MKLLFNAASLYPPKTGIGYYSENLIRELYMLDEKIEIAGWFKESLYDYEGIVSLSERVERHKINDRKVKKISRKVVEGFSALPVLSNAIAWMSYEKNHRSSKNILDECNKKGFLYHETNFVVAPYKGNSVVTIHDLSHDRFPEHQEPVTVALLKSRIKKSMRDVRHIIADSHFTKREIVELYGIEPEKISVVLLGVSSAFAPFSQDDIHVTLCSLGLRFKHYALSVCTLQPRKNLLRLVTAYSRLPRSVRQSLPLVLIGVSGWKNAELFNILSPMVDRKEVYVLGYIPHHVLVQVYAGAAIFTYPSLYEGFGLPVLEAMASGTPVLTSNNSSIPEVSAGAAIEVDPYSIEEILHGLDRLMTDTELRNSLVEKGKERAQFLSWKRTAIETLAVYNRVTG